MSESPLASYYAATQDRRATTDRLLAQSGPALRESNPKPISKTLLFEMDAHLRVLQSDYDDLKKQVDRLSRQCGTARSKLTEHWGGAQCCDLAGEALVALSEEKI